MENQMIDLIKKKEDADRMLLRLELVVGCVCIAIMLALCAVAYYVEMEEWLKITLIIIGLAPFLVAMPFMIKIEQTAGYYVCKECGHKHIPAYSSVFISMHFGTTRYMKCPKCNKRSWQKKVISKD